MRPLILQSDFGYADGAVSAMYGVAECVSDQLRVYDLTHDIPQYDIWEASYRLIQTVTYWPEGSVFVSVVDPGVGSTRRSIVVRTVGGQYVPLWASAATRSRRRRWRSRTRAHGPRRAVSPSRISSGVGASCTCL